MIITITTIEESSFLVWCIGFAFLPVHIGRGNESIECEATVIRVTSGRIQNTSGRILSSTLTASSSVASFSSPWTAWISSRSPIACIWAVCSFRRDWASCSRRSALFSSSQTLSNRPTGTMASIYRAQRYSERKPQNVTDSGNRGNTLFCCAVNKIWGQLLLHKMTNSRAVFIACIYAC